MLSKISQLFSANRIVVSRFAVAGFCLLLLLMQSGQEGKPSSVFLFALGFGLIGIATTGRLWCALYISGYKGSNLVMTGPYSICRNPLYLFSMLGFVGIGFTTETYTLGIATFLLFAIVYPSVIAGEEKYLRSQFGAAFDEYCARIPRFIPSFKAFQEPESYTVNPRVFRRAMNDIIWFVWAAGLIELIEALHEQGFIQPWFTLP